MDDQLIEMIRDRFDDMGAKLDDAARHLKEHVDTDARYWRLIDEQQAQISLLRWMTGGGATTALATWLYSKFGGH